jgi:acetyl-CoA C-acetyltransferase
MGAQSIMTGNANIVVVGGSESMSNTPFYLPKFRSGNKYGHAEVIDGIVRDGLQDPYTSLMMGDCAEICAEEYSINREDQDRYAEQSYVRAIEAFAKEKFKHEIIPISISVSKEGPRKVVLQDENLSNVRKRYHLELV